MFQGSFTIQNTIDISTISPYCEITGDLTIDAAGVTSLSLPLLQKIDGALSATTIPDLVTASFPALTSASSILLDGTSEALATVEMPSLTVVATTLEVYGGPLSTVDLTALQSADLTMYGSPATGSFSLPSMVSGSVVLQTSGTVSLPNLVHPSLVNISGGSIDLSSMVTADTLYAYSPTADLTFPALTSLSQSAWFYTAGVAHAPNLVTIGGGLLLQSLSGVDLPSLKTLGGTYASNVDYSLLVLGTTMTTLALPSLTSMPRNLQIGSNDNNCASPNTGLTQLDLPALTTVGSTANQPDGTSCGSGAQCCSQVCTAGLCGGGGVNPYLDVYGAPVLPACRVDALAAQLKCGATATTFPTCPPLASGPCP